MLVVRSRISAPSEQRFAPHRHKYVNLFQISRRSDLMAPVNRRGWPSSFSFVLASQKLRAYADSDLTSF